MRKERSKEGGDRIKRKKRTEAIKQKEERKKGIGKNARRGRKQKGITGLKTERKREGE